MQSFLKLSFVFLLWVSCITIASAQPSNDNCNNALPITQLDGTCINYDFNNPTWDFTNGSCYPNTANNIWFNFTAQGEYALINIVGDPKIAITVLTLPNGCGNIAGATEIACGISPLTVNNLNPGDLYYIIVGQLVTGITGFDMCVLNPPPPPNDEPCNAIVVPANGCTAGTTVGATPDFTIPGCPNESTNNAVFYSYTLGPTTIQLDITIGTNNITGMMGAALLEFPNGCAQNPFFSRG